MPQSANEIQIRTLVENWAKAVRANDMHAGLIDEMHLAIAPVFLGGGERLFEGIDVPAFGYECSEHIPTQDATHIVLTKRS